MSDTSLSDALPPDTELEKGLREAVRDAFQRGDRDSITVKRIRTATESKLGLDEGFFKEDLEWKDKSKSIITSEVDAHDDDEPPTSSPLPKSVIDAKETSIVVDKSRKDSKSRKRKSDETPQSKPRKKRKSAYDGEVDKDAEDEPPKSRPRKDQGRSSKLEKPPKGRDSMDADQSAVNREDDNGSESDMSILLDEDPKPKRKKRSSSGNKPKATKTENVKAKKSTDSHADPDAEEIKRLQGWLIKCGIRKMWYKELAPYDSPKLKIKHLKEMLADAGMTGRYSKEKADQIRDQRELKADLEAVQEGEKTWGKSNSEDEKSESDKKPRRRLARGLQGLDFLGSDDGEETD